MTKRRERNDQGPRSNSLTRESTQIAPSSKSPTPPLPPSKKLKRTQQQELPEKTAQEGGLGVTVSEPSSQAQDGRPKSKKELRAERKKARRLSADPDYAASLMEATMEAKKKEEEREELKRLIQEERKQKQLRQQKKMNRDKNHKKSKVVEQAKQGGDEATIPKVSNKSSTMKSKKSIDTTDEVDIARKIMHEIKYGSSDESGWTTLHLGVKYKDLVVGKGELVQSKSLVTVKYQLTGGKFGTVIDSSRKFNFRLGKGEVIQGWDIGMAGMRVGGRRQLVVPPKAGYGSQDIGAGPGELLHFDVTVLAVRVQQS